MSGPDGVDRRYDPRFQRGFQGGDPGAEAAPQPAVPPTAQPDAQPAVRAPEPIRVSAAPIASDRPSAAEPRGREPEPEPEELPRESIWRNPYLVAMPILSAAIIAFGSWCVWLIAEQQRLWSSGGGEVDLDDGFARFVETLGYTGAGSLLAAGATGLLLTLVTAAVLHRRDRA
ncbi:hypothetical protein [Homoserinibacter sp. YIM 151385]|uniref:hypothetical protein n=1 Tax=Homoserinibacter sp. YIM 151385 TaxID=2985506 RepID=UPI0022F0F8E0|nr:hypothetical protein [Homoserinibacter sp. YIM 151385]WBU37115.1 hypothetical protein OF852_09285 [Homoserinibacter sp. YIM 151385]